MRGNIFNVFFLVIVTLAASPGFVASALTNVTEETRTLDELHQAALAEGGLVTLWHGGDEPGQQNMLKTAFEARFPGMALNVTVDLSKHHDVKLDQQIAHQSVYVDSIILQTWSESWNVKALEGLTPPKEYPDFLKPEFKDKLNSTWIATFTNSIRPSVGGVLNAAYPTEGKFVSWPQTGAILKNAPHPEGAKLLHNFLLTPEHQKARGSWSTRSDVDPPAGFPKIVDVASTAPAKFAEFMSDRGVVERLRFFFETKIGTAQGLSPLIDGI
ncbi:hypothetical protein BUE80_DR010559 [Diplocarpon rosae]|nr:hypothetical protein BUE80_DR010559 [Diplocarpon rosae]